MAGIPVHHLLGRRLPAPSKLKAIFLRRLKFFAALMFHTRHASSPNARPNTQWCPFSMLRWALLVDRMAAGSAAVELRQMRLCVQGLSSRPPSDSTIAMLRSPAQPHQFLP